MANDKTETIPGSKPIDWFTRMDELQILLNVKLDSLLKLARRADKAKHLQIATIPFITANTEVKWQFPLGTKRFVMHTRSGSAVRMATERGKVAGSQDPYFTLKANTAYSDEDFFIEDFSQTIYFACAVATEVLEIIMGV